MSAGMAMFVHVYRSFIDNGFTLETTQISFNWWMAKQIVGHIFNGLLINNIKEQTIDTCNNIDKSQKCYTFM